jgi:polyisoprenoid-binding protein YceI
MKTLLHSKLTAFLALAAVSFVAVAAPIKYKIDPNHTYPSFEADHKGGLSIWRGKFKKSSGDVMLDREGKSGSVDVSIDMTSIDFGHDGLNAHAKSAEILNTAQFPAAVYRGNIIFNGNTPAAIDGFLTMRGITKPVKLTINSFLCKPDAMTKVDVCGADAVGAFNRDDFGITFGKGFRTETILRIQVEAQREQGQG